jgi:hypothetical protein
VPLVTVDEDSPDGAGAPLVCTATWGYVRLRRTSYSTAQLVSWAERIRAQPWTDAYAFLKHQEGSPTGPASAQELRALLDAKGDEDHDRGHARLLL